MKCIKYLLFCITIVLFLSTFLTNHSNADPLGNWVAVTSPSNHWFNGISYGTVTGSALFVTVGDYGTILTSPDGVAWTSRISGDTHHLGAVGYGNGAFVAVGIAGTILNSTNGINWTLRTSPNSYELMGVTYGNGTFVAVGANGTVLTSSDGISWTSVLSPTTDWLYGAIYSNSTFVDVGAYATTLYSTTNGHSWSHGNITNLTTSPHLMGVAYGNSIFVAVGYSGTILTSTNGVNWSVLNTLPVSDNLLGVAFGTVGGFGYFVAVGESGTIITSEDGANWTQRNSGTLYDLEAVAYNSANNAFAAVGGYGIILLDGDSLDLNGDSVPDPVRVWRGNYIYYSSVQAAYDNAFDGNIIESQALQFNEPLIFDNSKTVIIKGGYNSTYSSNPSSTTINGAMTISDGTVVVENVVIQ